MEQIEVGGKLYQLNLEAITIGDFFDAFDKVSSGDKTVQATAAFGIMRKALGLQMYEISVVHYSYVFGQIVSLCMGPLSNQGITDEVDEIVKRSDEGA